MTSKFLIITAIFLLSIVSNAQVSAKFNIDNTEACQTLTVNVENISLPNPDTIIWNFGDGVIDTILNPTYEQNFTHTYNTVGNYTITLTAILGSNSDYKTQLVRVYPLPDANFSYELYGYPGIQDTYYYSNMRYIFSANHTGDTTHIWTINGIIQSLNTDSIIYNFNTTGNQNITHSLTINGCTSESSQAISLESKEIKIPNVFSPNYDGINDVFYIQTNGETVYKFTVLNRFGSKVFISEGKVITWDGRTYWGEELSPGSYYYTLEPSEGEMQKGVIYLAR